MPEASLTDTHTSHLIATMSAGGSQPFANYLAALQEEADLDDDDLFFEVMHQTLDGRQSRLMLC